MLRFDFLVNLVPGNSLGAAKFTHDGRVAAKRPPVQRMFDRIHTPSLLKSEFNSRKGDARGRFQAMPDILLATVIVEGQPVTPTPLPTTLIPFEDLSQLPVDRQRHLMFQIMGSPSQFLIDGQMFDPDRIDQTVQLNALAEWVIHNTSEDWHPFHIHVNDFQVVAVNGEPIVSHSYDVTYLVPPYGSITMRTRFLDFKGTFVYHCHILFHEDHGMMGVVAVV